MFETRSRFDNRYITNELRAIDLKRQKQGRDTVLPLNRRENVKYIHVSRLMLYLTSILFEGFAIMLQGI